jgi:hypothetical protein
MKKIEFRRKVASFGQGRLAITVPEALLHLFEGIDKVDVSLTPVKRDK